MSLRKRNQMWVTTRNKRFKMVILAVSYISECHSDIFFLEILQQKTFIFIFFFQISSDRKHYSYNLIYPSLLLFNRSNFRYWCHTSSPLEYTGSYSPCSSSRWWKHALLPREYGWLIGAPRMSQLINKETFISQSMEASVQGRPSSPSCTPWHCFGGRSERLEHFIANW